LAGNLQLTCHRPIYCRCRGGQRAKEAVVSKETERGD